MSKQKIKTISHEEAARAIAADEADRVMGSGDMEEIEETLASLYYNHVWKNEDPSMLVERYAEINGDVIKIKG